MFSLELCIQNESLKFQVFRVYLVWERHIDGYKLPSESSNITSLIALEVATIAIHCGQAASNTHSTCSVSFVSSKLTVDCVCDVQIKPMHCLSATTCGIFSRKSL